MRRRYIICFDGLTEEKSKKVTQALRDKGLAWWHWIDDVWFAVDSKGKYSASEIRDDVLKIAKQRLIVVELNEDRDTWAGARADDPEEKMFKWLKETWKS